VQHQSYKDLVELATICIRQARGCILPEAATELRGMAKEYQEQAAALTLKPCTDEWYSE